MGLTKDDIDEIRHKKTPIDSGYFADRTGLEPPRLSRGETGLI
jgi:hypothetical protein